MNSMRSHLSREDEEFTGELIYPEEPEEPTPESTSGRRTRGTRVDYFTMHTGRPK